MVTRIACHQREEPRTTATVVLREATVSLLAEIAIDQATVEGMPSSRIRHHLVQRTPNTEDLTETRNPLLVVSIVAQMLSHRDLGVDRAVAALALSARTLLRMTDGRELSRVSHPQTELLRPDHLTTEVVGEQKLLVHPPQPQLQACLQLRRHRRSIQSAWRTFPLIFGRRRFQPHPRLLLLARQKACTPREHRVFRRSRLAVLCRRTCNRPTAARAQARCLRLTTTHHRDLEAGTVPLLQGAAGPSPQRAQQTQLL